MVREYLGGKNVCFFGVFDGHGSDGAKVSNQLVANLPYFLTNCKSFEVGFLSIAVLVICPSLRNGALGQFP